MHKPTIKNLKLEFNTICAHLDDLWEHRKKLLEELIFCCKEHEIDRINKINTELDELRKKADIYTAAIQRINIILFNMLSEIDEKQSTQN